MAETRKINGWKNCYSFLKHTEVGVMVSFSGILVFLRYAISSEMDSLQNVIVLTFYDNKINRVYETLLTVK